MRESSITQQKAMDELKEKYGEEIWFYTIKPSNDDDPAAIDIEVDKKTYPIDTHPIPAMYFRRPVRTVLRHVPNQAEKDKVQKAIDEVLTTDTENKDEQNTDK